MAAGMHSFTDNWLMQEAVHCARREIDPLCDFHWFGWDSQSGRIVQQAISYGAVGIDSLLSLLEQIVYCEKLYVLKGWTAAWRGKHSGLDKLFVRGVISDEYELDNRQFETHYQGYLHKLGAESYRSVAVEASQCAEGLAMYWGQVVDGAAKYLTLADLTSLSYCPHPARRKYLDKVLYWGDIQWPSKVGRRFEKLIENSKLSLVKKETEDVLVLNLCAKVGAAAMLCLFEADERSSPIDVAIQLRSEKPFVQFREDLGEMQIRLLSDAESCVSLERRLSDAVDNVNLELGLRRVDATDGFETLAYMGLPVKIPECLRKPIFRPKHSTIIRKLLRAYAMADVGHAIKRSLGIDSRRVLEDLLRLV